MVTKYLLNVAVQQPLQPDATDDVAHVSHLSTLSQIRPASTTSWCEETQLRCGKMSFNKTNTRLI